ncbi:uncharacterized protein LOC133840062 [Drosophila sulfurigaster albostrigata]|uniref:uncharacterized protein LOC133840062 n=1 Tax=Drosophila sulfurigaster albostrigata TaxID=89887 RepID=UPI002D21E904|nr:uncharacterized protein LOC133840062 [Drosophila sulfurigaster albostrigata]
MTLEVVILLILGLSSGVRATAITGAVLARQQDDAATQVECPSFTSANSPLSLESIVRAIVDGDWQRHRLVLQLVKEARTLELKRSIYETLWLEWKQTKKNNDPIKLLDLYEQLKLQSDIPADFQQMVYQTFISRSAHLLSAPLHAKSRCTDFPLVTTLLQLLKQSPQNLTSAIFDAVFDKVLTFETPLSVAQRLGNFNASLTQLATLNFKMMSRIEVQLNSSAHAVLLDNLRQLVKQWTFSE